MDSISVKSQRKNDESVRGARRAKRMFLLLHRSK